MNLCRGLGGRREKKKKSIPYSMGINTLSILLGLCHLYVGHSQTICGTVQKKSLIGRDTWIESLEERGNLTLCSIFKKGVGM